MKIQWTKKEFGTAQEGDNLATEELADLLVQWLHHPIHFSSDGKPAGAGSEVRDGAKVLWTEKQLGLELGANDLLRANEERRKTYLPLILEKLYHYARYHFLSEEDLMSRQSATRRAWVNEEIVTFLKGWIVEHILVEDKKFTTEFQKAFPGKKLV